MSQDKIYLIIFILFMIAICGTVWGCAGYKVEIILGVAGLITAIIVFIWFIKNKDKLN
jgi:hypothetical protein